MYSLIGHDIRVIAFKKEHDEAFLVLDIITIVLFTIDIFLNSFAVEDYILSFLFWIDLISTLSILLDIDIILKAMIGFEFSIDGPTSSLEDSVGILSSKEILMKVGISAKLTRIVRIIRLLKLFRLFNTATVQQ